VFLEIFIISDAPNIGLASRSEPYILNKYLNLYN
jgi:hypothetical protein